MRRYEEQPPTTDTPDWKSISDKKPQQKLVRKCRTAGCSFSIVCELIIRTKPILLYMTKWFKQWFLTSSFSLCYYCVVFTNRTFQVDFLRKRSQDTKTFAHWTKALRILFKTMIENILDRKGIFACVCDNGLNNYLIFQWIFDLMLLMTF